MKRNFLIIPVIILCLALSFSLLVAINIGNESTSKDLKTIKLVHKKSNTTINLKIADTPQSRQQGLMGVTQLEENTGMFFKFADSNYRSFWMKDTPLSLDIIFLDENYKIVQIYEQTLPNQTQVTYPSIQKSKFVIELQSGWIGQTEATIGDTFDVTK